MDVDKIKIEQTPGILKCLLWKIATTLGKIVRRLSNHELVLRTVHTRVFNNEIGRHVKLHGLCKITDSKIGSYTYFGGGCTVKNTTIGKFCSIGPNFICGWGIHPTDGISTSPVFYSAAGQCGMSFCAVNKVEEYEPITIGNDVFIGANVIILDGVTVGDGAVIGAGAVVASNVEPYAIVGGVPAKLIRYRFDSEKIAILRESRWWDYNEKGLREVERHFFDIEYLKQK